MGELNAEQSRKVAAARKNERHPLELRLTVVCDACGSIMNASWVKDEEWVRETVIAVEKCPCDSPLLKA